MATVGLLHPGEMGAAVGGCLVSAGHEVFWDPAGRSRASTGRALAAGLTGVDLRQLVERSSVILSICPPHAALEVARQVADAGYAGLYLDANAVSAGTAEQVGAVVTEAGADYVDGGIIGPPPEVAGRTRLYVSGTHTDRVRALFSRSRLDIRVAEGQPYGASALKMAYASWSKGSLALLLMARALARAEGVEDALLGEWTLSQRELLARSEYAADSAAAKGWRWVAEMEEIAASMAAAGLPSGAHEAAAVTFERVSQAKAPDAGQSAEPPSTLDSVISAMM